jgi:hypothetical protein
MSNNEFWNRENLGAYAVVVGTAIAAFFVGFYLGGL